MIFSTVLTRRAGLLALAIALGFGFAGCQPSDNDRDKTVIIYSYDSLSGDLVDAIAAHMQGEHGLQVEIQRPGDTGALFTQLLLEKQAPVADVVIGLDESYLPRLKAEKMLAAYQPATLQLLRPELLIDEDYEAIPFDFGYITVNADADGLDGAAADSLLADGSASWGDLLHPDLRSSFIMLNPGTSSPGRNFLLFTIAVFGEDGYLDFWRSLKPNILTVSSGWSDGYGLYAQGEAPLVVSYETSPAYHRHFEETERYRAVLLDGAAYMQVELAGIVNGAPNREGAQLVMDYLVSPEFQSLIPLNQFMYPVHPQAELPASFGDGASAIKAVRLEPEYVEENFAAWLTEWEDVIGQ